MSRLRQAIEEQSSAPEAPFRGDGCAVERQELGGGFAHDEEEEAQQKDLLRRSFFKYDRICSVECVIFSEVFSECIVQSQSIRMSITKRNPTSAEEGVQAAKRGLAGNLENCVILNRDGAEYK